MPMEDGMTFGMDGEWGDWVGIAKPSTAENQ